LTITRHLKQRKKETIVTITYVGKPMIECIKYTPVNKNTCLGFATVYVDKWDIEINSIALHQKDGKRWISLPFREYEEEGQKKRYAPYFRFRKPDNFKKFTEAVKAAIDKHALTHAEPPKAEEQPF